MNPTGSNIAYYDDNDDDPRRDQSTFIDLDKLPPLPPLGKPEKAKDEEPTKTAPAIIPSTTAPSAHSIVPEIHNKASAVLDRADLPLEDLLQLPRLTSQHVENLLNHLQTTPEDQRIWDFIERIAPAPIDAQIVLHNFHLLTADLLDSILVIGSVEEEVVDEITGEKYKVYLYGGRTVGSGGIGNVAEIAFAREPALDLQEAVIKIPLAQTSPAINYAFELEADISRTVRHIAHLNASDPRLKNILIPTIVSEKFIILPKVTNSDNRSVTLSEMLRQPLGIAKFANLAAGMASALSFWSDYQIIALDNKDSNFMEKQPNGSLIDLGMLFPIDMVAKGKVNAFKVAEGMHPYFVETSCGVPHSPSYSNLDIFWREITGQLPIDISHKLSLSRVIEKYLYINV